MPLDWSAVKPEPLLFEELLLFPVMDLSQQQVEAMAVDLLNDVSHDTQPLQELFIESGTTPLTPVESFSRLSVGGEPKMSSKERRKTKQRRYEKSYRDRKRVARGALVKEWIRAETELRVALRQRLVVASFSNDKKELKVLVRGSSVPKQVQQMDEKRRELLELMQQELVERHLEISYRCDLSLQKGSQLFSGQTKATRDVRAQLNALPEVFENSRMFQFDWRAALFALHVLALDHSEYLLPTLLPAWS